MNSDLIWSESSDTANFAGWQNAVGTMLVVFCAAICALLSASASAAEYPLESAAHPAPSNNPATASDAGLGNQTDAALTQLAARWEALDHDQRRALLMEMKSRMARKPRQQSVPVKIRTTRRYGRIIRKSDGSVVSIRSTQIQVRRADGPAFGAGFEKRLGPQPVEKPAYQPPQQHSPEGARLPPSILVNGSIVNGGAVNRPVASGRPNGANTQDR